MKLNTLLTASAIYMGLAGLAFIFLPRAVGTGAVPTDPSPELVSYLRLFGSPFLGIAALDWMARNAEPSLARNAIIIGNLVGFSAITTLDLTGMIIGARPLTSVFFVVHLLFTLSFVWVARRNLSTGSSARAG